ncbi:MAG: histidine kinase, partial [Lysinibacillus sp.]
ADETGQSIGRTIIEQLGGTYQVEQLESGIRFVITLPFDSYSEANEEVYVPMVTSTLFAEKTELPKILIVEDDVVHAEVLQALLQSKYNVQLAHSAADALCLIEREKPDYLIIDEVMPEMDGILLTEAIRTNVGYLDLPIIMLVTSEYPTNISRIFEAGANDYIKKPATKEMLHARLSVMMLTKEAMTQAVEHEMAFLQAQIKPHFLYNSLSSIISFCYTDGDRAGHLLTMLSTYLRYIFDSGIERHQTTLERELEIIQAYVIVEQARFGERLVVIYDVDDQIATQDIVMPSLLIQPLVENAIRHGIFEKDGVGQVNVSIRKDGEQLEVTIEDDGVGMSLEQVEILLNGKVTSNQGIGFINVQRRVNELKGGNLSVQSSIGKGTRMTLRLPLKGI